MSWRETYDWRRWSLANRTGWPWRQKKKDEQYWRMMHLPNGSGWPWRRTKKEKQDWMKMVATAQVMLALIKGVVDVGVVFFLKSILKDWQLCLSFELDVLTT